MNYVIDCPQCDQKIKVPADKERTSVRCPACGHKTRLDERDGSERRTDRLGKKTKQALRKKSSGKFSTGDMISVGIPVALGFGIIGLSLVHPGFGALGLLVGWAISIFGFIRGCVFVAKEGSWVSFDYLEFLGPLRWIIAVGFLGLYVMGYLALWLWTQIYYASGNARKIAPWLGLQAFGVFVCIAAIIAAAISERMWRIVAPNSSMAGGPHGPPPPAFNNPPPPNNPAPNPKTQPPPENTPPPVVTGDAGLDKLLADLASTESSVSTKAAEEFSKIKPNEHRAAVARKLGEKVQNTNSPYKAPYANALGVWATADEVPILIETLGDKDVNTKNEVLKVIGKLHDERTVAPVVRCFVEFQTRYHAEQALKDLGPMAEEEVARLLNRKEPDLRVAGINILKDIATQQSIPALQAAGREPSQARVAQAAIAAINARSKQK